MARQRRSIPVANLVAVRGRFRAVWRVGRKAYMAATGVSENEKTAATRLLANLNAALANESPSLPEPIQSSPAGQAYLRARYDGEAVPEEEVAKPIAPAAPSPFTDADLLAAYAAELAGWAQQTAAMLTDLSTERGPLSAINAQVAADWLVERASTSPARHNRSLAIASRFYKWAVRTGRLAVNPFAGLPRLREVHAAENIVACSAEEREVILHVTRSFGRAEYLAAALAFYAGMRRGEVARARWADVGLDAGKIRVAKTKTGKNRITPIAPSLAAILSETPKKERVGLVVPDAEGWESESIWRLNAITERIREELPEFPAELISWNSWRHTFASILAQRGVGIDKISAWMGNTPEVCRRHYAQFTPMDARDEEIDKLG